MAFVVRRPFALASTLKSTPKISQPALRAFHNTAHSSKPSTISSFTKARNAFKPVLQKPASQRTYTNPAVPTQGGSLGQRLFYGGAVLGGAIIFTNLLFNRETREDGGMPPYERSYLNETFLHTGLGIGTIGVAARALHMNGWSIRLMSMNPWVVAGGGLVLSIGTMMGTRAIDPDNYGPKYAMWTGFNLSQALLLAPLMSLHPALLARAGLYTVAMMGSIAFVGATAKQEKYLYLGGPLLAGGAVVLASGLAPLILPSMGARALMWTERVWLYGGLAVFGGFTLWDTQKILHHARLAERGLLKRDAVNESIGLELDFLNIFIRMVQILGMQRNNRR